MRELTGPKTCLRSEVQLLLICCHKAHVAERTARKLNTKSLIFMSSLHGASCETEIVLHKVDKLNEFPLWKCISISGHMCPVIQVPFFSLEAN